MKYFIKTFGCQMNVSDSERLATFLEKNNYTESSLISEADLVIFNTCGIKQTAENRAYSMINNLRKAELKIKNQKTKNIVMTGCLAHRADVQKRMQKKVDLFTEIKNFEKDFEKISKNSILDNRDYLSTIPKHSNNFQAYVPIMTGCNNFCTYCVVPYARGREVSRPAEEILSEIEKLVANGYKNIILLGQNVNSYLDHKTNFPKLLKKINAISGKFWIQFISSHPKDMDDELIATVTKLKKVCEWIHLPMQAGNDEILQKMNRKYTAKHYLGRIRKIKAEFKKNKPATLFSISSDIIVGFPTESKAQFLDSAEVMEKSKFDMVFFGQFSPRPGTVAWKLKDDVTQEEKTWRENFLNEILKKTTLVNNNKYIGKVLEVLIEKEKDGHYFGKTRTQKNVKIKNTKKDLIGKFVKAKITKANIWNLEATI
ncbi:MAG: tRNA (N6-isopentenyl adenosine(37)-C2)-methylthiotransferase MiaB [bacterium]